MFEFSWPWIFFILPLPLLVYWLAPPRSRQEAALRVPFFQQIAGLQQVGSNRPTRHWLQRLVLGIPVIVIAPYPEPHAVLIDRYLIAASAIGIEPVLLINKIDSLDDALEEEGVLILPIPGVLKAMPAFTLEQR